MNKHIKIIIFSILLLTFNIYDIDSNSYKSISYSNDLYEENEYRLYFRNMDSIRLKTIINKYDIYVKDYIINDKVYYSNIDNLVNEVSNNYEDKVYYSINGIKIDGIDTIIENYKIIELEKNKLIY